MNDQPLATPSEEPKIAMGQSPHLRIVAGTTILRQMKTAETVARDIVYDIVADGLQEGSALPSEAKMLDQYGVSRESLREGLRLLEAQGLLSIRRGPGGGPIVGTVDPANLGRVQTLYYHLVGATYGELFDAWTIAEGYLAERAARHPDRQLVRGTIEPYLDVDGDDAIVTVDDFVEHHVLFHNALGTLAGNRVMQLSLMAIGQTVTRHFVVAVHPRDVMDLLHDDHSAIARAVIDRKPFKARDEMRAHLERVAAFYAQASDGGALDQLIEWH